MVKNNAKKRKYLTTHPWLDFQLNANAIDYELWMLLGEAQSKCEHIAGVPLQPNIAEEMHRVYLYKGASATTAIEGNTLSEEEARAYIEKKLELPPSKKYLGQEIENVVEAFNLIMESVKEGKGGAVTREDLEQYNRLVLEDLALPEDVIPGEIRKYSVVVGGYRGAPAEDCRFLLDELGAWLNDKGFNLGGKYTIASGILKAIIGHIYIAWIHPFGDGNGRTARMLELQILLDAGVPSPAAHLLSNHYNLTRSEYYRQLSQASKTRTVIPFIKYALQGFIDGLALQLETIRFQTLHVSWESYVYGYFKNRSGTAQERRRQLVLDLSRKDEPVPIAELRYISPRVSELYASKNQKVIYADVKELVKDGLLAQKEDGYEANWGKILAFLPFRKV